MSEPRNQRGGVRRRASIASRFRFETLESRELLTGNLGVSAVSPVNQSVNMPLGTNLVATFNVPLKPSSVSASTVFLKDANGSRMPVGLSYSALTNSVVLTPSVALQPLETFTATLKSGPTGVLAADGTPLSADYQWTFTTQDFNAPIAGAAPGVKIDRTTGLVTNTQGGAAQFAIELTTAPTGIVTIPLTSSNVAAGTVTPSQVVFTPSNWNQPQAVQITGTYAPNVKNNVSYQIIVGSISSSDPAYASLGGTNVSVINQGFSSRASLESGTNNEAARFVYSQKFAVATPKPASQPTMTPAMIAKQNQVLALVPTQSVTNRVIASGNWSDPLIWSNQQVPTTGANVWVMPGRIVTVDGAVAPNIRTIRVSGTLNFSTTASSSLNVDTIEVDPLGSIVMGTVANPIPAGINANVTFTDTGPINRVWDPYEWSRGLISLGSVSIVGAAKTGSVKLASIPQIGATTIVIGQTPVGWAVGDTIDIPGTSGGADEQFVITAISSDGRTITLNAPIALQRDAPPSGQSLVVADFTRNINFGSQNTTDDTRRGIVMLMNNSNVAVEYASFNALGRTDCDRPTNNPVVDKYGKLVPGTGTNPKDRWSFQIENAGTGLSSNPIPVIGSVVNFSDDWGFVNQNSNVNFNDNVAYETNMAGFATEFGTEIGGFSNNVAINGMMDGFFLNGTYVTFTNNTAVGFSHLYSAGVKVWAYSNADANGVPIYFDATQVATQGATPPVDPIVPPGQVRIEALPFHLENTVVYGSWGGIEIRGHQGELGDAYRSSVDGGAIWGVHRGVTFNYSTDITLNNLAVYGDSQWDSSAIYGDLGPRDLVFNNLTVVDWGTGIFIPGSLSVVIQGGFYNNTVDFQISTFDPGTDTTLKSRTINISGVTFGNSLPASLLIPSPNNVHYNIYLDATNNEPNLPLERFLPNQIVFNGQSVYYLDQAANFVVTGTGMAKYDGLTNAQLLSIYGICMRGTIAPSSATTSPSIYGGLTN